MQKLNKLKKSLRASFWDGIFASCMTGLTTEYLTPYALALKATTAQIGILSATPNLVSSLVQLKSPDITQRIGSRKRIINTFVLLHALMLLPIMAVPYVFKSHSVPFLILFVTLFTSFNAFAVPAWSSLMSDHIPYKSRGRFFGWRNKVMVGVNIVFSFAAGAILQYFKHDILKGFFVILASAFLLRLVSWYFLTQMYEPRLRSEAADYFSFFDFIKRIRESNFAKFVIFVAGLNFSVNLASPFFSVFMLRDLKFGYLTYTALITVVPLTQIVMLDRWGRHADRVGNVKVLKTTAFFIASLPLLWVICQRPVYLVFAQVVSGFAWAGFNLCATNFIYDAVTPQKRVRCIAYFNVLVGIASCLGAFLGGHLSGILMPLFGYRLLTLFLLASLLRFCVAIFFFNRIKEVRPIEHISSRDLFFSVIGLKPILNLQQGYSAQLLKEDK